MLFLLFSLILPFSSAAPLAVGTLHPNFTATNFAYIDHSGAFLASPNSLFLASLHAPTPDRFYFSVLHSPTNSVLWSSTRHVSSDDPLTLTSSGLSLGKDPVWSTPPLSGTVSSLRLLDTGNLQLLDSRNSSLWDTFGNPTDTFVTGQFVPVGGFLTNSDRSRGEYELLVTGSDVALRWGGDQQYWALSIDPRAIKNANGRVSKMEMNATGLILFDSSSSAVVIVLYLKVAAFRIATVGGDGRFVVRSFENVSSRVEVDGGFTAPQDNCDLPLACSTLGLCSSGPNSCSCPGGFRSSDSSAGGCVPSDGSSLTSNSTCSGRVEYKSLGSGVGYFGNRFVRPVSVSFTNCRSLCSGNCSCLGFFYRNSTSSCYLLKNRLGSVSTMTDNSTVGYLKTIPPASRPIAPTKTNRIYVLPIVLPSIAVFLLVVLLFLILLRYKRNKFKSKKRLSRKETRFGKRDDMDDDDIIAIPGLPTRFAYEELDEATAGFNTKIGSGGFGEVFKGTLRDNTTVAVKRINNAGVQRKKEFCTEIAIIGKIHHVNLVNLRGFCAQSSRRLLVYEYMNRGSLDRSLFSPTGPALEWKDRIHIAIGAAKGLAYLHGGCEHRILHCDVKPENILLHDRSVKISDFGLSKLLSPEQSELFTTMRGTRGYLAPEWLTNSAISDRTDVYSFGMVLLELIRGRKNWVTSPMAASTWTSSEVEGRYFPLTALERHEEGRYEELADPRLEGRVDVEELKRVVRIALCCLHEEPWRRPAMETVAGMLEGHVAVVGPKVESLGFLRFYGRDTAEPGGVVGIGGRYVGGNISAVASDATSSPSVVSYLSSQQVSGPR